MQTENLITEPEQSPPGAEPLFPGKPGVLHGEIWLSLQTSHAQRLFHGRAASTSQPAIVGLVGFANRLRVIWQGARDDDPYADWWLIKIHEGIEAAGEEVRSRQQQLIESLKQMKSFQVDVATSKRPYRAPLNFANPYAYQGAKLLSEFDHLVCYALTLRHIGLLGDQASEDIINAGARKLRSLFMIPQRYRLLKINREGVRTSTGRTQEARKAMGDLPADVLSGVRRAPLSPDKRKLPSGLGGQVELHPEPSPDGCSSSTGINGDGSCVDIPLA